MKNPSIHPEPSWPDDVAEALAEYSILSAEQVLRISEIENGVQLLSKITQCEPAQWQAWVDALRADANAGGLDATPREISPDELLTEDMVDFDPLSGQGDHDAPADTDAPPCS